MGISELESKQQEELRDFFYRALNPEYEQFQGVGDEYIIGNLVEPEYYGEFSENGELVLEVHGNMGNPGFFDNLNQRLEQSGKEFAPYAIGTAEYSPRIEDYVEELDRAYSYLKSEKEFESFNVVSHSLGCVGSLKWIHENDLYDKVDRYIPAAGPFKGVAAADLVRQINTPVNLAETSAKIMNLHNPMIGEGDVERFFGRYKTGSTSDNFVSRKSAEEGELAELMEDTRITEESEVYTIRSSIDRWYAPVRKIVPSGFETLVSLCSWKNRIDSPEIEGAEANFVLPSSTHNAAIEGDIAVEYIARILEEYNKREHH